MEFYTSYPGKESVHIHSNKDDLYIEKLCFPKACSMQSKMPAMNLPDNLRSPEPEKALLQQRVMRAQARLKPEWDKIKSGDRGSEAGCSDYRSWAPWAQWTYWSTRQTPAIKAETASHRAKEALKDAGMHNSPELYEMWLLPVVTYTPLQQADISQDKILAANVPVIMLPTGIHTHEKEHLLPPGISVP